MPLYYPSLVVEFTALMFDEALTVQPAPGLQAVGANALDFGGGIDISPEALAQDVGSTFPLILKRGDDNYSHIAARVPKTGTVELAGYRQASNFEFTFDFMDLPIDPRTVRQCSVSIFLGTVSAEAFGSGMGKPAAQRQSIVRTRTAGGDINKDALLMIGVLDEWEAAHTNSGSEVTIRGRDLRGLMLDVTLDQSPGMQDQILDRLDLNKPIDQVIRDLISATKLFQQVPVVTDPSEWLGDVPTALGLEAALRVRTGAQGKRKSGRVNPPGTGHSNMSFWDLIVWLCYMVGAIPYFKGHELIIRPVKGLYRQIESHGEYDPYPFSGNKQRTVVAPTNDAIPDGPLNVRRMVYGRDIEEISFNRKLGGLHRPRTVRVIAVNPSDPKRPQTPIEVYWPEKDKDKPSVTKPLPNAKDAAEEVINVKAPAGIIDRARLTEIARAVWEEIGRGELGGTCSTKNLASFAGDNEDADLLRLKPGDAVEFTFDPGSIKSIPPLASSIVDFHSNTKKSFNEMVAQVKESLGDDDNLARVIVATARNSIVELQRFFRTSHVTYGWNDAGLNVSFDFQNFVEVRIQNPDVGQQVGAKPNKISASKKPKMPSAPASDQVNFSSEYGAGYSSDDTEGSP